MHRHAATRFAGEHGKVVAVTAVVARTADHGEGTGLGPKCPRIPPCRGSGGAHQGATGQTELALRGDVRGTHLPRSVDRNERQQSSHGGSIGPP